MEWTIQKNGKIDCEMANPIFKWEIRFLNRKSDLKTGNPIFLDCPFHSKSIYFPFSRISRIFPFKGVREHLKEGAFRLPVQLATHLFASIFRCLGDRPRAHLTCH